MKKNIILLVAMSLTLSGCGIYTKYKPATSVPDDLYGGEVVTEDTAGLGNMDWRELFTAPHLQSLIETGLQTNTDYQSAQLRVEEAQAVLMSAKLAFLPAFALSPQGTVSSFDTNKATQGYSLPVTASWELDVFGRMRNSKKQAKALYAQSEDYRQAVRTQLIAGIANTYYTLLMLDEQLNISRQTEEAWKETVASKWDQIEVVSADKCDELINGTIESGKDYTIRIVIDEKGLDDAIGVELVTLHTDADGKDHIYSVEPLEVVKREGDLFTFEVVHSINNAGSFKVAYRMFPKNKDLPHRQDFCYVKWFN